MSISLPNEGSFPSVKLLNFSMGLFKSPPPRYSPDLVQSVLNDSNVPHSKCDQACKNTACGHKLHPITLQVIIQQ